MSRYDDAVNDPKIKIIKVNEDKDRWIEERKSGWFILQNDSRPDAQRKTLKEIEDVYKLYET